MISSYTIRIETKPQIALQALTASVPQLYNQRPEIRTNPSSNPIFSAAASKSEILFRKKYKKFSITEVSPVPACDKPLIGIYIIGSKNSHLDPNYGFIEKEEISNRSLKNFYCDCSAIMKENFDSQSEFDFGLKSQQNTSKGKKNSEPQQEINLESCVGIQNISIVFPDIEQEGKNVIVEEKIKPKGRLINWNGDYKIFLSSLEDNQILKTTPQIPKIKENEKSYLMIDKNNLLQKPEFLIKTHSKSLQKLKVEKKSALQSFDKPSTLKKNLHATQPIKSHSRNSVKYTPTKSSLEKSSKPLVKSLSISPVAPNSKINPYTIQWRKKVLKKYLDPNAKLVKLTLPKLKLTKASKPIRKL